jgi:hypothetical protein
MPEVKREGRSARRIGGAVGADLIWRLCNIESDMQCYGCGAHIPLRAEACPACGHLKSRLIYAHLCGVIGGVAGSLVGYTFYDMAGAFAAGLAGIIVLWVGARWLFAPSQA